MNLLRLYSLDASALYQKWEAYIINKDEDSMTQAHLEEFKNHLRRTSEQAQQRTLQAQTTSNRATVRTKYHNSGVPTPMNFVADRDHNSDLYGLMLDILMDFDHDGVSAILHLTSCIF
jgi:hypothetical protein